MALFDQLHDPVMHEVTVEVAAQRRQIDDTTVTATIEFRRETFFACRSINTPATAPMSCAAMNPGTSAGRIPAKVSLRARPMVIAGFAKQVEAVNQ
jgi:hypothetical protein